MKRPYEAAFRTLSNDHCPAMTLPPELWREIANQLIPIYPIRQVNYGRGPHSWSSLASLSRCCRFLHQTVNDTLYGDHGAFVFDIAPENSLPLFLFRLSAGSLSKIRTVEINYTGRYPSRIRDISPGLDLLLQCRSLRSLRITGLPGRVPLQHILECFRLQSCELLYGLDQAKWPRLNQETVSRATSSEPRTRKEQKRINETKARKVRFI